MTGKSHRSEKDKEQLRNAIAHYDGHTEELAKWLTARGKRLVADFREERMALQAAAKVKLAAAGAGTRKVQKLYSPLGLFCRYKNNALELYWQKVHYTRDGSKPKFFYVKKGGRGDYDLQQLASLARPYELDLVLRTEAEASVIRAQWRALVSQRRAIRQLERTLEPATT